MRRAVSAFLTVLFVLLPANAAETVAGLYRSEAIVTGRDNRAERDRGIAEAFAEILIKVTGDPDIAGQPAIARLVEESADFVVELAYLDRKAGIQISDEQGTRDRSYVLTVSFDEAMVNRALADLGIPVWPAERPVLAVLLDVSDTVGAYRVTRDSERGFGQRGALDDMAAAFGIPLALPGDAAGAHADATLTGTMTALSSGFWDTVWTLDEGENRQDWRVTGTTFDTAIRIGLGEAARKLARR